MKAIKWVVAILVVAVVVLLVGRNVFIRMAVEKAVGQATGFGLTIGSVKLNLFDSSFQVKDLVLENPPDFPEPDAFDVKELTVRYRLASLLKGRPDFREIVIEIPSITMVVKEDGESNVQRLKDNAGAREKEAKGPSPSDRPVEPPTGREAESEKEGDRGAPELQIDRLVLKLGTVRVREYRPGESKPHVTSYDLGVNRTYENVTDLEQVAGYVSAEIMLRVGPQVIRDVQGIIDQYKDDPEGARDAVKDKVKGLLRAIQK